MVEHIVRILSTEQVTHDVKRFRVEKPAGYSFIPGQATNLSVNRPDIRNKKRPFTFTGIDRDPYLEFIIKIYPAHKGVTSELDKLNTGDEIIIRDVWGVITYKGEGVFIAGGAGITPFISIFRDLREKNMVAGNTLVYANKTKADIILEQEFRTMLGKEFINILSDEFADGYYHGMVSEDFLKATVSDFSRKFYVCGPPPMMAAVKSQLANLGIGKDSIVVEF